MPRSDAVHLGVDVGTSGVRGVAIDANGAMVAQASAALAAPEAIGGGRRQDAELWWAAVTGVIRAIGTAPRVTGSIPWPWTGLRGRSCWRTTGARRSSLPECTTTPAPPIWRGGSRTRHRPRAVRTGDLATGPTARAAGAASAGEIRAAPSGLDRGPAHRATGRQRRQQRAQAGFRPRRPDLA